MAGVSSLKIQRFIPVLIVVLALTHIVAIGETIYVDVSGQVDFDNIQSGIDAANDGDIVLVAPGEYVITEPITFRGKAITVTSEVGPDGTTIRMGTPADTNRGSVVIFENNETIESILEGFTITGGSGSLFPSLSVWVGGGIYFDASSGTVSNCAIVRNRAKYGGGVVCAYPCSPRLVDCMIAENSVTDSGGGVLVWSESSLTLTDCIIRENLATAGGGGIECWEDASVTMICCTIAGNSADVAGGVFGGENSFMTLTNCMIVNNKAHTGSGGVETWHQSSADMTNCVIAWNAASVLGGGGINCSIQGSATVTNCIIWGNTAPKGHEIWVRNAGTLSISYSNVAGGQAEATIEGGTINWGEGNINTDPLFANPGFWANVNDSNIVVEPNDPNAVWIDGDYRLTPCSPCIDSGDPNYISKPNDTDLDNNSRVIAGRIDMGAYEYPFVYDKPDEGTTSGSWRKYSENPVFSAGESGQWDNRITSISVLNDNEEPVNQYKMWYVGGETQFFEGAGIGYATSSDGINWVRNENNPVLEPVEWWNTNGFSGICVIKDSPGYKLWYEGIDNQNTARIGYATSSDGINWDINNNPVFSPGINDAWDNEDVGNPCVIKEGLTYKMWYWGDNILTGIDQIGLAVSDDGIKWQRVRSEPVIAPDPSIWWQGGEGVGTPHVIIVNAGYIMAYHAADQTGALRIGLATSNDGLEWKKENKPILNLGDENSWESTGIVTGSFIQDTLHLKLWYLGIDSSEAIKIGLAISCDDIVFDTEDNI